MALDPVPAAYGELAPSLRAFLASTPSVAASNIVAPHAGAQSMLWQFHFDGTPQLTQQDFGVSVALPGSEDWNSPGDPLLPVRRSTILLPQGMEIASVDVRYLDAGTLLASGVTLAATPTDHLDAEPTSQATYSGSDFPSRGAVEFANHALAGYSLGTLRVFPVEYAASTGSLTYHQNLEVTVHLAPRGTNGFLEFRNNPADRARVAALVENPEALAAYDSSASTNALALATSVQDDTIAYSGSVPAGNYQYVIITDASLESSFQPLLNQKLAKGLTGAIFTTSTIYANYTGTENHDNADKIRDFIRDLYLNHGTQYVLLGGDSEIIPQRGVYANTFSLANPALPTDLYYACLDGTWNGDGDSRWGEWNDGSGGGDIDLVGDVYIGRAPTSNTTEVANFVAKTVLYETTSDPHLKQAVFLGEKIDSQTYGSTSAINIRDTVLPADWKPTLIERYDTASFSWNVSDLINDLNASPHIVNSLGHSNASIDAKLTVAQVQALTNAFPYLMYSQGCDAGAFDQLDVSIAEAQVVSPHGAFATVANTREGWYQPGDYPAYSHDYAKAFWDGIFNRGKLHLGEAQQYAKDHNLVNVEITGEYRWINFTSTLFGDPETSFQLNAPFARDDYYSVLNEATFVTNAVNGVLANDSSFNGGPITALPVTNTSHGSLVLNADGSFSYTPQANYVGLDSFTYRAVENGSYSNLVTVVLAVNPPLSGDLLEIAAVEGVPFNGPVAHFDSFVPNAVVSDFSAIVFWGDGQTTSGQITADPVGGFQVNASHTYKNAGLYHVQVALSDSIGHQLSLTSAWQALAPSPFGRSYAAAATAVDGRIFIFGGYDDFFSPSTRVDVFDPIMQAWGTVAELPHAHAGAAAVAGADGRFYLFGGIDENFQPSTTVDIYDPILDRWTSGASMPVGRTNLTAAIAGNDCIYIMGGGNSAVDVYDPLHNSWTAAAPLPGAIDHLAAATGIDGHIYAFGGTSDASTPVDTVWSFNPLTNHWSYVSGMPSGRADFTAVSATDGRIYLIGGYDETYQQVLNVDAYLPAFGTWTSAAALTGSRSNFAATAGRDGRLYLFGGTQTPTLVEALTLQTWVKDAALHGSPVSIVARTDSPFSGLVASFTDDNPFAKAADFTADISWGDGQFSVGTVTTSAAGGFNVNGTHTYLSAGAKTVAVTIHDVGGSSVLVQSSADVSIAAKIVGEYLFYNNSRFDGHDPQASAIDDAAIAPGKSALRPGQTASFANYTSYSRGLNGIMLDIADLTGNPTTSDFTFRMGNDDNPADWPLAPQPTSIIVRAGAGQAGSSRVELVWADRAITNTWLEIAVQPTVTTGLARAELFYFGNAIGESGNDPVNALVNTTDEVAARNNSHTFLNLATANSPYDFDRDGFVNATDQIIARSNATSLATALKLIHPPPQLGALQLRVPASEKSLSSEITAQPLSATTMERPIGIPTLRHVRSEPLVGNRPVATVGDVDKGSNCLTPNTAILDRLVDEGNFAADDDANGDGELLQVIAASIFARRHRAI